MAAAIEFLECYNEDGDGYLDRILLGERQGLKFVKVDFWELSKI